MHVTLNGESHTFDNPISLSELVVYLGLRPERLAIELNGSICPRALWATTCLQDADRVEIVHFVGGGEF